ncbi:hypothetical protein [Sphingobacterium luzhongxinii]|uniref:hypothetical protein n=1 Tax=Sphingobacterium luzhongxinii TaxID=2654181 RepID=UPI001969F593|nr:hypothetical protein [Sphingobacterium sp. xlx-73]
MINLHLIRSQQIAGRSTDGRTVSNSWTTCCLRQTVGSFYQNCPGQTTIACTWAYSSTGAKRRGISCSRINYWILPIGRGSLDAWKRIEQRRE